VVKSVDTADLKSAAHKTGMPVRFRPRAPQRILTGCRVNKYIPQRVGVKKYTRFYPWIYT